jgi:UDP-N-acetylmuramyl pentapeptide phosphotransferase/UDP-N-acetylglucosamine-1-phosphate transferase
VALSFRDSLAVGAVSLAAAAAGMPLFLRAARHLRLLDRPNARSVHVRVTPRGGGVVLLLAAALGLVATGAWRGAPRAALAVAAGAAVMAVGGLWDDRFHLPAAPKFALQGVAAAIVVWGAGGVARLPLPAPLDLALGGWGAALAVAWLVVAVNFYNFLDGIDGLAGSQGAITGAGIALAAWDPWAASAGAALAGASAGFLAYNWSPARVFMGDAGSTLLGFTFAALPLLAPAPWRPAALLFVATSLGLFLADASWTLFQRARRGAPVTTAHREHVYQRLVASGLGHAAVAGGLAAGAAALTALGLFAWRTASAALGWLGLAAIAVLFALELTLLHRRAARPVAPAGGEGSLG